MVSRLITLCRLDAANKLGRYDYMITINVENAVDEPVRKRVRDIVSAMLNYLIGQDGALAKMCKKTLLDKFEPVGLVSSE